MRTQTGLRTTLTRLARDCTLSVLSSLRRSQSFKQIEENFDAAPAGRQRALMAATVGGLFGLSLIFAQAGIVGIAVYLALIYLLIK